MNDISVRGLWLASALLLSLIIGLAAGVLSFLAGDHVARAMIAGGAALLGTATFLLLALTFIGIGRR